LTELLLRRGECGSLVHQGRPQPLSLSHPDLRTNSNARIHVRQDQVTHMHRRSEYQNTV
jgi:hypothetical protein